MPGPADLSGEAKADRVTSGSEKASVVASAGKAALAQEGKRGKRG